MCTYSRILLTSTAGCLFWGLGTGLVAALRSSNERQSLRSTGGGGQRSPTSQAASLLQQEKTWVGPRTAAEPRGEDFLGRANCAPSFLQSNCWGNVFILQSPAPQGQGAAGWRHKGLKLLGRQLAHWGRAQTSQNFWGSLSLWPRSQPIPFTPLSQDLSPPQYIAAAAAKALQSCPTLCDPTDGSPPGSPVPGILQARTLEWVAISFSNAWKCEVKVKSLSRLWLFVTPWTAAHQAPPSMGFSRQEHWSGVPLPSLQYILRFSQNKTSSDLQLCHFKEMLYFMGSSEHHRDRKEASVREARWDWNYQGWADILGPVPPGGRASGHGTILVRRHRSGLHQNMCCQLWEDGGPPSTQVKAHSSLATLDPKYSDRVSKEGFNNLLLSKQK